MNRALEFHDSTVAAVKSDAVGSIKLLLRPAYIHESNGTPGVDEGTGWHQTVKITLAAATVKGTFPKLPCQLQDGCILAENATKDTLIPVPFTGCRVELSLLFGCRETIIITAKAVDLTTVGAAKYVERFR